LIETPQILLNRTKTLQIYLHSEDEYLFVSTFKDEEHDMEVRLLVEKGSGTILSADAKMNIVPYGKICRQSLGVIKTLEGMKITKGITKDVYKNVGGVTGCTHLVEIALEAMRGYVPALGTEMAYQEADRLAREGVSVDEVEEQVREKYYLMGRKLIPNTCLVYNLENEYDLEDIRKGNMNG